MRNSRSPSCAGSTVQNSGSLARGPGDRAEGVDDEGERLRLVELAGHQQHRVVGLVIHPVERLEVLLLHVLDVAAVADGGSPVAVPVVGHALQAFQEHAERGILAHLEFVAHDGHLGRQVGLADEGIHHPVGLHLDGPPEVVVSGLDELVVVGAVEPGGAVGPGAALVELLVEVGVPGRALEHQVLEQVRHARLAVVLVAAADEVGDVHRDRGLGEVGEEQDLEAVVEPVFRDALDRGHPLDPLGHRRLRQRRGRRRTRGKRRSGETGACITP